MTKKKILTSTNPHDYDDGNVVIFVDKAYRVPKMDLFGRSDPYVVIHVKDSEKEVSTRTRYIGNDNDPVWAEALDLGPGWKPNAKVHIEMWDYDMGAQDDLVGFADMTLGELCEHTQITILLSKDDGNIIIKHSRNAPTEIRIKPIKVPTDWSPIQDALPPSCYPKHVMIMTRGTRGDVQPYVALARGLAEQLGWLVTICTELRYKDFVKSNAKVANGAIRFRPSGGDTAQRIDSAIAKWAMQHKSEVMQTAMLARSEREFFDSEPVLFYWAEVLRPDAVIYGFTMANIAIIISEKLRIPVLGFILQPTVIPSTRYNAVVPISTHAVHWIDEMENKLVGHEAQSKLKSFMENNPFTHTLNEMRKKHGLRPFKGNESETWHAILAQRAPLVIPINALAFGGKPPDWPDTAVLTDFIFLRKGGVPPLPGNMVHFIERARAEQSPVLVMAFSSMPVERYLIMEIAVNMVKNCARHPHVIALVGDRDLSKEVLSRPLQAEVDELIAAGKLLEDKGAPFGELFKFMDCIIVHGGLGTTAEALRAGVPTIVTGVLLMDQRFWGRQCHLLGVGPDPVHITDFNSVCVSMVDEALTEGSDWRVNAARIASQIQAQSEDGVPENVQAIADLLVGAQPLEL